MTTTVPRRVAMAYRRRDPLVHLLLVGGPLDMTHCGIDISFRGDTWEANTRPLQVTCPRCLASMRAWGRS